MKPLLSSLFLLCAALAASKAQNLVMNYSFEQYSPCPGGLANISYAAPWVNGPASNSSDLFNVCCTNAWCDVPSNNMGNIAARTGNGYAGVIHYYEACCNCHARESIEGRLSQSLTAGQSYTVEWWVANGSVNPYTADVDRFGMILTTYQLTTVYPPNMTCNGITEPVYATMPAPQVQWPTANGRINSTSWTKVSGTYVASGGEQWIAVGNFYNNSSTSVSNASNTSYYFIDDVCVVPLGGNCAVAALPVELVSFKAVRDEKGRAVLEWQTASETNIDYFTALRSTDNTQFESVGIVPASGGRIQPAAYRLADEPPAYGTVYYRLQQTDYNGTTFWSGSAVLDEGHIGRFSVAGAVCEGSGLIRVSVALPSAGPVTVHLVNSVGLVVHSENLQGLPAGLQRVYLDPGALPAGIYYVRAVLPDGSASSAGLIRASN